MRIQNLLPVVLPWCLILTATANRVSGQELSREEALVADLKEAADMIDSKEYDLLIADFMPAVFAMQRQMEMINPQSNSRSRYSPLGNVLKTLPLMKADFVAAIKGRKIWNRDQSMVRIQYTTAPVEKVPARKAGFQLRLVPEAKLNGFGTTPKAVLESAIQSLEREDFATVAKKLLPAETAVVIDDQAANRWVTKLKQNPAMAQAMLGDLKAALDTSADQQFRLMEKVAGQYRLRGLKPDLRRQYSQLAGSHIEADIIPAMTKSMILSWSEGRWRIEQFPQPVTRTE